MVSLRTLGGLALRSESQTSGEASVPRRRLALLAVLAASGSRGISRDRLLALFWPESDAERASNALSQALFVLRRHLPPGALPSGPTELRLDPALVPSDVASFESALDAGDLERAVAMYDGPFLDGVFLRQAPEFERWLDDERARLARRHTEALERLATTAAAHGDHARAVAWWRQLAATDPLSSRIALKLVEAHVAAGDRAAALRHARVHEALLRQELGSGPDPIIAAFVARMHHTDTEAPTPGRMIAGPAAPPAPEARSVPSAESAPPPIHPPAPAPNPGRRATRRRWLTLSGAAVLTALVLWLALRNWRPVDRPRVVAVLPFSAVGPASDLEYIADGLTEELIGALAQLPDIRVVARTSAFRFKGDSQITPDVGSQLGSDAVVTGSVRMSGSELRVLARLVRVADGRQLWAAAYQRDTGDLIAVQEEIASDIAHGLSTPDSGRGSTLAGSTQNAEAHRLYLRALFLWNKRRPEDLRLAISYFERAAAIDPNYALAYAQIADAYVHLGSFGAMPLDSATALAEAAARHALTIDERVGTAHASLARIHQINRNWAAAEHEYRRAIELNPSDANAHSQHAFLLLYTGHAEAGRREMQRAYELDPVSIGIGSNVGWMLYFSGQDQPAIDAFRRVLELDPESFAMYNGIGRAYEHMGRMQEAVASYREALRLSGGTAQGLATLGHALARSGHRADAVTTLRDLEGRGDVDPYVIAILYTGLDDADHAFAYLARAVRERSPLINQVTVEPLFSGIHADPRFGTLLEQLGVRAGAERAPLL